MSKSIPTELELHVYDIPTNFLHALHSVVDECPKFGQIGWYSQ